MKTEKIYNRNFFLYLLIMILFLPGLLKYPAYFPLWLFPLSVLFIHPYCCKVGPDGVKLSYLIGFSESTPWENIRYIRIESERSSNDSLMHYIVFDSLEKNGKAFFLRSRFPATKKAKEVISRHAHSHGIAVLDYQERNWFNE